MINKMFYDGKGKWVEPFKFSLDSRKLILGCFGGASGFETGKSKKANRLIDSMEPKIELWVSLQDEPEILNSDLKRQLESIVIQCNRLVNSVCKLDEGLSAGGFRTELDYHFFKNNLPISTGLVEIGVCELSAVAKKMAERLGGIRSISKPSEKALAKLLAECYLDVFGSLPGYSEEGNFSKVAQVVAKILNVSLGQDVIKYAVDELKKL